MQGKKNAAEDAQQNQASDWFPKAPGGIFFEQMTAGVMRIMVHSKRRLR